MKEGGENIMEKGAAQSNRTSGYGKCLLFGRCRLLSEGEESRIQGIV